MFVRMDKDPGMSVSRSDNGIIPFVATPALGKIESSYTRWQLPLALAHAITVHKAQGITALGDVVVQPTPLTPEVDPAGSKKQRVPKPFAPGLEYVACSRCKELKKLHLLERLQPIHFQSHRRIRAQIAAEYARLEILL